MKRLDQNPTIKYIIVGVNNPNIYVGYASLTYFTGTDFSSNLDMALWFDTRSAADTYINDHFKNECMFSYGIELD